MNINANKMNNLKRIILIGSIFTAFSLVLAASVSVMVIAQDVYVDPPNSIVSINDTFKINITISGNNITGTEFELLFNNAILNATDMVLGPFLQSAGPVLVIPFPASAGINNSAGNIKLASALISGYASGTSALVTITFKAKSPGVSQLDLHDVTLTDENLNPIPGVIVTDGSVTVYSITFCQDNDGDGYGVCPNCNITNGCTYNGNDCNDNDASINPGAAEICNGVDDDCDGNIDEGLPLNTYYRDADGDNYGNPTNSIATCSTTPPLGYVTDNTDCNDNDASIHPGAAEVCGNGIDEDCNGSDLPCLICQDNDLDGYGVCPNCNITNNCIYNGNDCNDNDASINPGAAEICNGEDDDCDGSIDEGGVCPTITYYCDTDSDGYFDSSPDGTCDTFNCVPAGCQETQGNDCNDNDNSIHPGASEVYCNGIDEDCNGFDACYIVEVLPTVTNVNVTDTFEINITVSGTNITGADFELSFDNTILNATNMTLGPFFPSSKVLTIPSPPSDGINNSAGNIKLAIATTEGYYSGTGAAAIITFKAISPGVSQLDLHDVTLTDENLTSIPGVIITDGSVTVYQIIPVCQDTDGDGYGVCPNCNITNGCTYNGNDCDDYDASINPGAAEICNGVDDNCDGNIDEGLPLNTYYRDADGDTYGNPTNSIATCSTTPPLGYVTDNTDCNDNDASINPGATEIINGVDDDCDGYIDENHFIVSTIPLKTGWNLIGLPLNDSYTAESMLDHIASQGGNCTHAYEWTTTWNWHEHGGGNDFDLNVGKGYFLRCVKNSDWNVTGTPLNAPVPVDLGVGWNLISIPYNTPSTAESMLDQITSQGGDCTHAYEWTTTWNWHEHGGGNDFDLNASKGYFLRCVSGVEWVPS